MSLAIVAALSRDRVIGKNNQLPWHLPADLRHFKQLTLHKTIVMGRHTFESIGKALPQRHNIVVTRQTDFQAVDVTVANSIEQALTLAKTEEVMIIGGAQLYEQLLPQVDTLYLTLVDAFVPGDTYFPQWQSSAWQTVHEQSFPADEQNPYPYTFLTLTRVAHES
jgi:dihydrofolate reductase